MKDQRVLIVVLVILALLVIAPFVILQAIRNTTESALDPIRQSNESIRTQVAVLLHPTPTILPDPISIIREVRSLSRLETIQYSVEKVITAETRQGFFRPLFGDRLLFVAHGIVIAGVDLEKLGPEDLSVDKNVLSVRLPEAEIFITSLDNDRSYVYDRQTGVLTKGDINLETLARQAAEDEIRKTAEEDGILGQAQLNAEAFLSRLFLDMGYADIIFIDRPEHLLLTATPDD